MHLLHQSFIPLLNLGELKEAVVNPMGSISVHKGLIFQTPAFSVVSNVRRKKDRGCILVSRRRNFTRNAVSVNQMESNMVVKEDTEFKSSFDEYLKAMESVRVKREKKQVQRESGRAKKPTDVEFRRDVSRQEKHGETSTLATKVIREKKQVPRESGRGKKPTDGVFSKHGETSKFSTKFLREKKQVQRESGRGKKPSEVVFSKDFPLYEKHGATSSLSTRDDKEKKQVMRESGHEKKLSNVSLTKAVSQSLKRGETNKFKWIKRSSIEEGGSKRSKEVIKKEEMGGRVEASTRISSQKESTYLRDKYGASKKFYVDATASRSIEFVKKKSIPKHAMSVENGSEMERFIFQPEFLNDDVHGSRVTQMEMEGRIQILAKSLNDADMDMPEWMFAKTMRSARIRFSDHSMLRIIQILGKFDNWRRVLQLIEWLQMHERYKSRKIRYVYTAALDALGKAKRPVEAFNLFCSMQMHKTTYPDIVTYHSIAVTLGQAGHMRELFDVIDSMRSLPKNFKVDDLEEWDPRLQPDIVVYNAVLNGCATRKEWEGAIWVLQKLEEIGEQPTSATYGLVMEVMLACEKYDLVHEYFNQMQGVTVPNVLTYRVRVNTLWKEGKPDEAIAAVQNMESQGLVGSASLYYDLARCLCSVGRCEEGLMQVHKICKVASKPLVVTYTGLIQACLNNGSIHNAISIFNHMQKHCSPNTVTCNIMLKAYLGYGMLEEAKDLFRKMIESGQKGRKTKSGIMPDLCTFKMMLEAFVKEQRWDDFELVYEKMLQHGHPFNIKRHLWMVLQASGAGKVEVVETTWRHLLHNNHVPPPALVKERFRLNMATNNLVEAVSSIACHPSSHQQSFSREAWLKLFKDNAHCFNRQAIERLICEVKNSLLENELPNLIYQNLLDSCMEYARLDTVSDRTCRLATTVDV